MTCWYQGRHSITITELTTEKLGIKELWVPNSNSLTKYFSEFLKLWFCSHTVVDYECFCFSTAFFKASTHTDDCWKESCETLTEILTHLEEHDAFLEMQTGL